MVINIEGLGGGRQLDEGGPPCYDDLAVVCDRSPCTN